MGYKECEECVHFVDDLDYLKVSYPIELIVLLNYFDKVAYCTVRDTLVVYNNESEYSILRKCELFVPKEGDKRW